MHLKLECCSATLNKDTVLHEEDDENIHAAALALSKANVGLVPLTLLAQVERQVVSLLQMLHQIGTPRTSKSWFVSSSQSATNPTTLLSTCTILCFVCSLRLSATT